MTFKNFFINCFRFLFSRSFLYKFNLHLYKLSLRSLGILNSEGGSITGEDYFLNKLYKKFQVKVIFDVGANDGGYSTTLRKHFSKAKIYAFEPHPLTFARLKKTSKKQRLNAYQLGLGEKTARGKIWDFADDATLKSTQPTSTLASVYKQVIEDYHGQKAQAFNIRIVTLDNFTKEHGIENIDFLKVDCEGDEYKVLLGAKRLLKERKISVIQFEFNEMNVYSRVFFRDFVLLLKHYDLYRLLPRGLIKISSYRPVEHEIFAFQNIVAILKKSK